MRRAEFVMAAFSLSLMWKSTELPIGWIGGLGPGDGARAVLPPCHHEDKFDS